MENELKEIKAANNYGLSRKTNVAMAAIAGLSATQQSIGALTAITIIALVAISLQFVIDYKKVKS